MTTPKRLIYTPKERIPIGEGIVTPEGVHSICFKWKRGKKDVTETVTLDKLHELVAQLEEKRTGSQRSP